MDLGSFFVARIFWILAGVILWAVFYHKVLWSKKIEEKYFGDTLRQKPTEEGEAEKR